MIDDRWMTKRSNLFRTRRVKPGDTTRRRGLMTDVMLLKVDSARRWCDNVWSSDHRDWIDTWLEIATL